MASNTDSTSGPCLHAAFAGLKPCCLHPSLEHSCLNCCSAAHLCGIARCVRPLPSIWVPRSSLPCPGGQPGSQMSAFSSRLPRKLTSTSMCRGNNDGMTSQLPCNLNTGSPSYTMCFSGVQHLHGSAFAGCPSTYLRGMQPRCRPNFATREETS